MPNLELDGPGLFLLAVGFIVYNIIAGVFVSHWIYWALHTAN